MTENSTEIINTKQGYKKTKLGWIPQDWRVKSLGELGDFSKGKGITKKELVEQGFPAVRYGEIYTVHNFGINEFYSFINEESAKNSIEIINEDLLFAGSGETLTEIGKCVSFTMKVKAFAGGDIIIFRNHNQSAKYLGFLLNQNVIRKQTYKLGQGNSVVHIYASGLKTVKIPLPLLPEQTAIANCLSVWDAGIQGLTALIAQKELLKKGLMQQLLTGKTRLKGFGGEWEYIKGGQLFKNHTDKDHNGDLQVLSATQDKGVIPRSEVGIDIKYDKESLVNYKKVKQGNFVISLRSFQGGIEYSNHEGLISPAYTILKEDRPISKGFYKEYLKTQNFISILNTIIYGIRDGKQVSYKEFATLKIAYPPIEEQTAIAQVLQCADNEITLLNNKLTQLKTQKRGLMQQLLMGKKRLNQI